MKFSASTILAVAAMAAPIVAKQRPEERNFRFETNHEGTTFKLENGSINAHVYNEYFNRRLEKDLRDKRVLRGTGSGKGKSSGGTAAAAPQFFVYSDDYDNQWQVINGLILEYSSDVPPGETTDIDLPDLGFCGETMCETGNVKALVTGEEVEGGDLIIVDFNWDGDDEIAVICPEIFQTMSVEILGCEADDPTDCAVGTPGTDEIVSYGAFSIDLAPDGVEGAGALEMDTDSPAGDWVRVRAAFFCADPDPSQFLESIHQPAETGSGKGKTGKSSKRRGRRGRF